MPTAERPVIRSHHRWPKFPEHPLRLANDLSSHPLFSETRIRRLLEEAPRGRVEVRHPRTVETENGRYQRVEQDFETPPVRAFEQLADRPTWINVHAIQEYDPEFRAFLAEYLEDLKADFGELGGGIHDAGCYLILSSGRGVVHFHSDPDQSVLNQIRGTKTVYLYPASLLEEKHLEHLLRTQDHGAVPYREEFEEALYNPVPLGPGDSAFLPLYAPHRVTNGREISFSLSVGFNTRRSLRRKRVHLFNSRLRRLRFPVVPYGRSPILDSSRSAAFAGMQLLKDGWRR